MTPEKLKAALTLCTGEIIREVNTDSNNIEYIPARFPSDKIPQNEFDLLTHVWWMAEEAKKFVDEGRLEKAQRWLGFIQGVLWSATTITVDQMKSMNKPDEAAPFEEGCTHHSGDRSQHE